MVEGLPVGGHVVPVELLEEIEARLAWPAPMLHNLVQIPHNNMEADRLITLTPGL